MHTTIKFAKIRENAIIPNKRDEDAGIDLFPCFDGDFIVIPSHSVVKIPTGLCCAFDKDYVLVMKERSSIGSKNIGQRAGIIDSGYRGELIVPISNHNDYDIIIYKPDFCDGYSFMYGITSDQLISYSKAICQALLLPIPTVDIEEYTYDEIQSIGSQRGIGGFGSTDKE